MSIFEPHKCQTYWGSHGCRKLRSHRGGHACDCGIRITPNGLDPSGFAWTQYGADAEWRQECGGLMITESAPAAQARLNRPRPSLGPQAYIAIVDAPQGA